jgi:hypothetical protein
MTVRGGNWLISYKNSSHINLSKVETQTSKTTTTTIDPGLPFGGFFEQRPHLAHEFWLFLAAGLCFLLFIVLCNIIIHFCKILVKLFKNSPDRVQRERVAAMPMQQVQSSAGGSEYANL